MPETAAGGNKLAADRCVRHVSWRQRIVAGFELAQNSRIRRLFGVTTCNGTEKVVLHDAEGTVDPDL